MKKKRLLLLIDCMCIFFWQMAGAQDTRPSVDSVVNISPAYLSIGSIDINKIVSINNKFFRKTKLQLMWDFLSYQ